VTSNLTRSQVLGYRVRAQQLDRGSGPLADTAVLDIGVQDTGPDGSLWALATRGVEVDDLDLRQLATAWTVRGAPHVYRRGDLPSVAAAVEPFSDADAGKRIFDASKPLKAAGIGNLEALDAVAAAMRDIVTEPMVKGEVSARLTACMGAPYLRECRPCKATHIYEQPFRLAALRAGLELQPGTSPPVLTPVPGLRPARRPDPQHDVVRAYLHLFGSATPKHVSDYLDAAAKDVKASWPEDAVEVSVEGEKRWVLEHDLERLRDVPADGGLRGHVRLLGPYDLFLQAKDRTMLVADPARAKALWPVLGRPGAVLLDGDLAGTWRPRQSGRRLTLAVTPWRTLSARDRRAVAEQAERLAGYRGVTLTSVEYDG
jgi:hypothetical protein